MKRSKVFGTLYGAAYGDSLGAISEFCTKQQIAEAFPDGLLTYQPSISFITRGTTPGIVTDDFSSSCYLMRKIIKYEGHFNKSIAIEAILDWAADDFYFGKFSGANTEEAVLRVKNNVIDHNPGKQRNFMRQNTNGGAMKVAPLGILARNDWDLAIKYTIDLCYPTHYNSAAISGAAAICCAVCEAQNETNIDRIIEAGIYGAVKSRELMDSLGYGTYGPYLEYRIRQAVELGKQCHTLADRTALLNDIIGTGIVTHESIPAVFGLLSSTNDFQQAVLAAVNAGGDTDTIASMTGAIMGAYLGVEVISQADIRLINEVNQPLAIEKVIDVYADLIETIERMK